MRYTLVTLSLITLGLASLPVQAAGTCKAPRVLIVLDKSSSMVTGSVGGKTKWEVAKSALSTILNTYQASIDFGLMVFPNPNQCGPGAVKVSIGSNTGSAIMAALSDPPPAGGNYTPMAQSLDVAAKEPALHDSTYSNNVLLISDGWQYCIPEDFSTRFLPVSSVSTLTSLGITTYVVGFGESVDTLTLNKMASAANTKVSATCDVAGDKYWATNNCYYQANDLQQLLTSLQKIAKLVSAEKCDNQDNDCNGKIDDGLSRACSSACGTGAETCAAGSWGGCTAAQPAAETCDGKDNNCDGTIDEGCSCKNGETRPCGTTQGDCRAGTQSCTDGTWSACQGEVKPGVESCDGKDNNCDGTVDEGLTQACKTACGTGMASCVDGSFSTCSAPQPTKEICDGSDNDCDGEVDGPNAVCAQPGAVCVDGTCRMPGGDGGCDCRLAAPEPPSAPLLLLLGLAVLLAWRSRRR